MNLISNCCIAGYLYQQLNEEFKNPFQWCFISPSDLIFLIRNYKKINFSKTNFSISKEHKNSVICDVDSRIRLKYIHYIYDKDITFKQSNHNIKSNRIIEYSANKYKERLKRMSEKPVFLYVDKIHQSYTGDSLDFIKTETEYKKILITDDKDLLKYNSNKLLVILDTGARQTDNNRPFDYANKYGKKILEFVKKS